MFGGTNKMPQEKRKKAKAIVLPIVLFVAMYHTAACFSKSSKYRNIHPNFAASTGNLRS